MVVVVVVVVFQAESGQQQANFSLWVPCQFCWQLEPSQYTCSNSTDCMTVACPRRRYNATCEVHDHVHCLGTSPRALLRYVTTCAVEVRVHVNFLGT